MENEKIKQGDLVQLKSGGPIMTFSGYIGAEAVCVWFDKNSEFKTAKMFPSSLRLAKEEEKM
ncbi:DUF2158 domain-containing protein [Spirosoma agri]|uniref:DUF2158 domain-containing protein n=1 Tax=Spirosoma agri TaxID=1987381 RepID=A0A6M0IKA9_9BACT|nr:DUF2158 domain-containing protein [Spirosoma agri]NEU68262.1 DUF2158 domain-containing protein [Spirosoma agri]